MTQIIESNLVLKTGLYRMSAEAYHADPCPSPSLSSTMCKILARESARHGWSKHPRLRKQEPEEFDAKRALGSAIHKMALGHGSEIARISGYDNYMKAAAKEERDNALNLKQIPLLDHQYEKAEKIAVPLRIAAEDYLECKIEDAYTEIVIIWKKGNFWRRAMIDAMRKDFLRVLDLKSTEISVAPSSLSKFIFNMDYHLQSAFYLDAVDSVDPDNVGRREFAFIFGEASSPFLTSAPMILSEAALELGKIMVGNATFVWEKCLAAGEDQECWPGYSPFPFIVEPPSYLLTNIPSPMEE